MKSVTIPIKIGAILTGLFLITITSCTKDPQIQSISDVAAESELQVLIEAFDLSNFEDYDGLIIDNISIEWGNYITKEIQTDTWYEFEVTEKYPITFGKNSLIKSQSYTLLASMQNGQPQYYLNQMLSYSDGEKTNYLNVRENNYHGIVNLINMKGEIDYVFHYEKGIPQSGVENIDLADTKTIAISTLAASGCNQKASTARCQNTWDCSSTGVVGGENGGSCGGTGGAYVWVKVAEVYKQTWYFSGGYAWFSGKEKYIGDRYGWVWINNGGSYSSSISTTHAVWETNGEGYTTGNVTYSNNKPRNARYANDETIIETLDGKEDCMFESLSVNGGSFIKAILRTFEGDNSEFDLRLTSVDRIWSRRNREYINGRTLPPDENNRIVIEISTSKANSHSALEVVRTIMHELIHADMFRALNTTGNLSQSDLSFLETYNMYDSQIWEATAQHNSMADLYVENMALALKKYHIKVMPQDYNFLSNNGAINLDLFYEAMAWTGLRNDGVNAWNLLPQVRKDALEAALEMHIFATTKDCPTDN